MGGLKKQEPNIIKQEKPQNFDGLTENRNTLNDYLLKTSLCVDEILENEELLLAHSQQIFDSYDIKRNHVLPFRTESTQSNKIVDLSEKQLNETLLVYTGNMGIVSYNQEILTTGSQGCISCFIQGNGKKSLIHMVSTNNPRFYGFLKEENFVYDYDPVPETLDKIFYGIKSLGDLKDINISIIGNERVTYSNEKLLNLKKAFLERGIKSVKIEKVKLENTTVYHSPKNPGYFSVIGTDKDGKKVCLDIPVLGDDIF